jgi:MFS family permease
MTHSSTARSDPVAHGPAPKLGSGFWRMLGSAGSANLGDGIRVSAFPLLALALTRDPIAVAGLAAMEFLPWVAFGPIAGAIVDRVDHRCLMLMVNLVRALAVSLLAAAVFTDLHRLWMLYLVAVVIGIGESLYDTATLAWVPRIVPEQSLTRANSLISTTWTTFNEFLGPLIGAKLFELAKGLPFLMHAVFMYASTLFLVCGRRASKPATPVGGPRPSLTRQVLDGWKTLAGNKVLRATVLAGAAIAAADSAWFAVLVVYVTDELHASSATYGVLLAVSSLGGIAGGLLMERIGARLPLATVLTASVIGMIGAQLGLFAAQTVVVAAIMLLVSSMAIAAWNIVAMTIRQRYTAADAIGRITGTSRAVVSAAAAVSALAGGTLAHFLGVRGAFLLGIPLVVATSIWAVRMLRRPGGHDVVSS